MEIRGTDFVLFLVSDLLKAVAFYRDTLGLPCEIVSEEYQWAEFDCGNVTLSLKGKSLPAGALAGGRIALAVADIFATYEELKAQGFLLESPPADHGCCRHLDLHDPDGNLVILHQRADGTVGQGKVATQT